MRQEHGASRLWQGCSLQNRGVPLLPLLLPRQSLVRQQMGLPMETALGAGLHCGIPEGTANIIHIQCRLKEGIGC